MQRTTSFLGVEYQELDSVYCADNKDDKHFDCKGDVNLKDIKLTNHTNSRQQNITKCYHRRKQLRKRKHIMNK